MLEDKIDVHVGGYLSNVCLACMPVYEEHKLVNMIGVCLDTTITTSKCSRYTFRPFDFAPSQAVAIAPYLVNKIGKKWHIAFADYAWGQSTRDAYVQEIKKLGGEVTGTTGVPLGTADMTTFLSKISGAYDGLFGIFFGPQGISFVNQSFDLGISKKARIAGDGAIAVPTSLPAMGAKADGFVGIDRYVPVLEGQFNTPYHKRFLDESVSRLQPLGVPAPDRYVQSNFEAVNFLKLGMERSKFRGREDTMKLIEALEGMEVKESDDFPRATRRCARRTTRPSCASSSSRSGIRSTRFSKSSRRTRRSCRVLNTPFHKRFLDESVPRLQAVGAPAPDRYVQSNFEAVNFLKVGMERSKFRGREDTMKLIEALEGLEVKESDDFPQGDKTLRKDDHQAFVREFIFEVRDQKFKILDVIPKEKTVVPAACKFV